jgi:hypothetical protein
MEVILHFLFVFYDAFGAFTSTYWDRDCILFSALILLIGDKKGIWVLCNSACSLHLELDVLVFLRGMMPVQCCIMKQYML